MDPDALNEQISKLHEELANVRRLEPRSSQLLGEIMLDIQRLTATPAIATAAPSAASLPDRLEEIAVRFEADHPTLAASSRRLVDLLGKAGL
ncbi:MAG: DUF4404 family protein [Steroidobacteraceae bacterium]|jgi:hypothetical protein